MQIESLPVYQKSEILLLVSQFFTQVGGSKDFIQHAGDAAAEWIKPENSTIIWPAAILLPAIGSSVEIKGDHIGGDDLVPCVGMDDAQVKLDVLNLVNAL